MQTSIVDLLQETNRRLTVVGDDYQSIYAFRGAQPNVFGHFIDTYEHPELKQKLTLNYR